MTANHILKLITENDQTVKIARANLARIAEAEADPDLAWKEKQRIKKELSPAEPRVTDHSVWFAGDGSHMEQWFAIAEADLALIRLGNFNASSAPDYPVFKNPATGLPHGTSLCKLGFPFSSIVPEFNTATRMFSLPDGALPLPVFPIDGIFTRRIDIASPGNSGLPYPVSYLETSTPGLMGQSGGPTFDKDGNIWAMQSMTNSIALGFEPPVPTIDPRKAKNPDRVHQFMNVGMGTHVETIVGLMRSQGIDFKLSDD